jgi:epsilon-lactone hydrolase
MMKLMHTLMNKFTKLILKLIGVGNLLNSLAKVGDDEESFIRVVRKIRKVDIKQPPRFIQAKFRVTEQSVAGFPLFTLKLKDQIAEKVILHFHGGSYVVGPNMLHWITLNHLSSLEEFDFALFDYPKAPEYQASTTMDVSLDCYKLLTKQYGAGNITLMGDSAGGGLALALAMELVAQDEQLPSRLVLFSPWLDLSMENPEARDYDKKDVMLNCDGLVVSGTRYAGSLDIHHPWVSPRFGKLEGLPPMYFFVSTSEVFWPDIRDFVAEAQANGLEAELIVGQEMPHDYPVLSITPGGRQALDKVIEILSTG